MTRRTWAVLGFAGLACHCGGGGAQNPPGNVDAGGTSDSGVPADAPVEHDASPGGSDAAGVHDAGDSSTDGAVTHDAGKSDAPASGPGVLVNVTNDCPFDLWIHAVAQEAALQPDNAHLAQGATQSYHAPLTWTAGRVYAYFEGPDSSGNPQGQNDKIEANFYVTSGSEYVNSDITYVDWVALPSQIQTLGTGSDCTTVGCQVPSTSILAGCPSTLLSGHECLSAGYYCLTAGQPNDPYCHALDSQIAACASEYPDCAGAAGSTTAQVYSCSGAFFGASTEYCAALNRGVLATPAASTPPSAFYQTPPFDTYAQWVHQKCPGIYAFPYDDFGSTNQSSDHTCTGATQMNVTFCPKG